MSIIFGYRVPGPNISDSGLGSGSGSEPVSDSGLGSGSGLGFGSEPFSDSGLGIIVLFFCFSELL